MSDSKITKAYCDEHNQKCVGVAHHDHHGCDVVFTCQTVDPASFEAIARRDIDLWLAKDQAANGRFGRTVSKRG